MTASVRLIEADWAGLDPHRYYRYFVAEDAAAKVMGTLGTYHWNGLVTEIASERTMPARAEKLPVQDLLHWHAFVTHRERGDRWFDLAGFNPSPETDKEAGIRSFKEKWRGRPIAVPRFELDTSPALYRRLRAIVTRHEHA